jgi:hypothetical protein
MGDHDYRAIGDPILVLSGTRFSDLSLALSDLDRP